MDINFELYKIFYHAAKLGNFSEAAEQLFITQSAISQAIKNLETKLGVRLFHRKTRQLKLTPEGELLFTHIEQAYNFIKTAEQKVLETKGLQNGEIRIGASDTVCRYFLLPTLESFNKQYPKIKIQFSNRTSGQILQLLQQGSIDFGVVTLPIASNLFEITEVKNVEDIWVAGNKYKHLQTKQLSLSELANQPLLLLEKTSTTRRNLDEFFQFHQLQIKPEIELESVDLLVEFARIGLGIAHVLKESAQIAIASDELFQVKVEPKMPPRKLGVVTMKNVPPSHAAIKFIDLLTTGY
ncbi:MAG TPA: LysR family transcriptional regulator [Bacillota bacterium]|nr:LysR family transcriptional regulator [Bacillota bacterium]HOL08594.1 LysR family transcriptional regulator [Bacillota bacterium]HPO98610.1 LysR family transcriptional regulator [Bacillota bacterium]